MHGQEEYFVRWRGELKGPFAADALKKMTERGELSKLHEVSTDRVVWRRAGSMPEFYPPYERKLGTRPASGVQASTTDSEGPEDSAPGVKPAGQWYYARGQEVEGPCSADEIVSLIQAGKLTAADHLSSADRPAEWKIISAVPAFAPIAEATMSRAENVAAALGDASTAERSRKTLRATAQGESHRGTAAAGMVLSLVGILIPPCGLIGLALGIQAWFGMRRAGNRDGFGMATVGVLLGMIEIIVWGAVLLVFL